MQRLSKGAIAAIVIVCLLAVVGALVGAAAGTGYYKKVAANFYRLPASVTAPSGGKAFGVSADPALPAPATTGFLPSDAPNLIFTVTREPGEAVGTYAVKVVVGGSAAANYSINYTPGVFTITSGSATVKIEPSSKDYGTPDRADMYTLSQTGMSEGDWALLKPLFAAAVTRNPGEYATTYTATITPLTSSSSGSGGSADVLNNYTITYVPGALKIKQIPATLKVKDATKVYGTPDPAAWEYTSDGFTEKDKTFIVFGVTRSPGENVGTYTMTPFATHTNNNYVVTVLTGTLTITKAQATVTAPSGSKVYG